MVELHDCFTVNEILAYEALGLTAPGTSEQFFEAGDNTYGGRVVVNPSGGLLSKGTRSVPQDWRRLFGDADTASGQLDERITPFLDRTAAVVVANLDWWPATSTPTS